MSFCNSWPTNMTCRHIHVPVPSTKFHMLYICSWNFYFTWAKSLNSSLKVGCYGALKVTNHNPLQLRFDKPLTKF